MKVINIVLSGGVGSRLWPLSRRSQPKQYIPVFDGLSLFQMTVQRNRRIADALIVVGNRANVDLSKEQLRDIDVHQTHIVEAIPRNTAAAIAFGAFAAAPEDILVVTPSD